MNHVFVFLCLGDFCMLLHFSVFIFWCLGTVCLDNKYEVPVHTPAPILKRVTVCLHKSEVPVDTLAPILRRVLV